MKNRNSIPANWAGDRYINRELFESYLKPGPNGCLLWTGHITRIGYGLIGFTYPKGQTSPSGKRTGMMSAHRAAFQLHHGRAPSQPNINHLCHVKNCCEPSHLREGTQQDKIQSMATAGIKGGRQLGQTGLAYNHKQWNRTYKRSEEEINWIRYATTDEIVARYGMPKQRASAFRCMVRDGYRWLPFDKSKVVKQKPGRKKSV